MTDDVKDEEFRVRKHQIRKFVSRSKEISQLKAKLNMSF
jgi:hypothetical protein